MGLFTRVMKAAAVVGVLGMSAAMTGCASQAEIDKLYETNRSLQDENARLSRERDEAVASLDLLRKGAVGNEGAMSAMQQQLEAMRKQRDKAMSELSALDQRIAGLQIGRLDPETDRALETLAKQYADLMTYDAESGMLRFNSDLTFDSGSDQVKPQAKTALQALAQVLNSTAGAQYEVWVVGHTDSQPISAGTSKRHPTNRHLSAHRGIAVIEELGRLGVSPSKMMAAGWGEFRPAVPNTGRGNTPANRRVEIYLAKGRGGTNVPAPAPAMTNATPEKAAAPTRRDEFTK